MNEKPFDEAEARHAVMKIVAVAERFCEEARGILLEPHGDPVAERHKWINYHGLTIDVLQKLGAGDLTDELMVFLAALGDLDDGVVHPILRTKVAQKPSIGSQKWRLRGMCAVAVEYLVADKEPLADAAKKVARIPGIEKLLSGRAKSANARKSTHKTDAYTSVIKWRITARGGKKMDEILRIVWASRKTLANIGGPQEFRKEAKRLIEKIRRELRTLPADG